jgi:phosphoribosylamine--glycine ligase
LAHVSFDPEDMIEFLEWLDEHWQVLAPGHKPDFVLQQAVKGIELAVTCFFDGEKFRPETCYLNREIKRFMPGDYGPPTGQMGEVGIVIPNARLFQAVLKPLEGVLRENGYCQFIDVNCIVASPDTVVPLEFTARPGYPTIYSIIEAADEPIGQMLYKLATRSPEPIRFYPGFVVTVVVATNKFPYTDPLNRFCYLRGVEKTGLRHVHLAAVKWEKGQLRGADDSGYLAVVTGRGRTIEEARRKAFGIVEQLEVVPFALVRQDVGGECFQKEFEQLAHWGWLE